MINNLKTSLNYHKVGFRSLYTIHKLNKKIIPSSIVESLLRAFEPFISIIITALIIDKVIQGRLEEVPQLIILLVVLNFIVGCLIDFFTNYNELFSKVIQRKMVALVKEKVMMMDYCILEDANTLKRISDAEYAMERKGGFYSYLSYYKQLGISLLKMITSVSIVVALCFSSNTPMIGLWFLNSPIILLIVFISITILNIVINKKIEIWSKNNDSELFKKKGRVERKFGYYTNQVFLNYPMGKDIRVFGMFDLIHGYYLKHLKEAKKFFDLFYYEKSKNRESGLLLSNAIYMLLVMLVIVYKAWVKAITVGSVTKYIGAITVLNKSISTFITTNQLLRLQSEYIHVINEIIKVKSNDRAEVNENTLDKENGWTIEFHDVSFSYPNSTKKIINHLSFKINANEKLALVGVNGAGKTTIVKLMCGLYEPTEGLITMNGIDIKEFDFNQYTSYFSVVFQDFNLFALPLDENISTSMTVDSPKVMECALKAGVMDRINSMEKGMRSNLYNYDDDGIEVSGGEAQKVAIARALYKDAPFVILDEPTASLDPISEADIYSKFGNLTSNKTALFISHRMSSCKFSDRIIVLDEGVIVQEGTHEELIIKEGSLYEQLFSSQAKFYI